jgi:hypothetical protein
MITYLKESNNFLIMLIQKCKVSNMKYLLVCLFDATFKNISFISWWSVLLLEEAEGPAENHRPVASR